MVLPERDDHEQAQLLGGSAGGYLSVAQVARRLGCSVSLVQKWRRLGWLPATRLGPPEVPVYGYRPEEVERFVRERWNRQRGRPAAAKPPAKPAPSAGRRATTPSVGPSVGPSASQTPSTSSPLSPAAPPVTSTPAAAARTASATPLPRASLASPTAGPAAPLSPALPPQTPPSPRRVAGGFVARLAGAGMPRPGGSPPSAPAPEPAPLSPPPSPAAAPPSAVPPFPTTVDEDEITDVVDTVIESGAELTDLRDAEPPAPVEASPPAASALPVTSRPLVLWSGDPRDRGAMVLARFPAADLEIALSIGTLWSKRYDELALGEAASASGPLQVLLVWRRGIRHTIA